MQNLGRFSEGKILSNVDCVNLIYKKSYRPAPRAHLEPRDRSWQWAVRSGAEQTKCKDLCVPKICPKKSFFPRFKKTYIPVDKKSCITPKKRQTWKEYFSFLLPDRPPKPPLIQCRKLQAQRRVCCGNPFDCGAYCLRDNCCPMPKEWYGQAVVYEVPSSFPEPSVPEEPKPCAPPPPTAPVNSFSQMDVCPENKTLNMDDYVYKKAFSGINVCDEDIVTKPRKFKCKSICIREPYKVFKQQKLTCGFSTELKQVECPQPLASSDIPDDLPPLVCKISDSSKPPTKVINVEEKKGVCERTTFLKPYKYGEKYPGMGSRSLHTLRDSVGVQKCHYSTGSSKLPTVPEPSPASLAESSWVSRELPAFVKRSSFYQPSRNTMALHSVLTKPIAGIWRQDNMYFPEYESCRSYAATDRSDFYDNPAEIDPKLLALAEETKKKMKHADPPKEEKKEKAKPPLTLARKLSDQITQRMIKRAKEGFEENTPSAKIPLPISGKTKLSLLKKPNSPVTSSRASFMTSAADLRKTKQEDSNKKNTICSGCPGIRDAEKEAECPSAKSLINCKVRSAGRCRGPERKLKPGDPQPDNPYYRYKTKPYSLCNKPRPVVKKEERSYKLPCDENQKRKYHTSSLMSESAPAFVTISEFMKTNGISMNVKNNNAKANVWDSHTPDSYQERDSKGYDSVPDLAKFDRDGSRHISLKSSFSSSPVTSNRNHLLKMDSQYEESLTAKPFQSPQTKTNDWGVSTEPYDNEATQVETCQETKSKRVENSDTEMKKAAIKVEASTINLWEPSPSQHLGTCKGTGKNGGMENTTKTIHETMSSQELEQRCSTIWSDEDKHNHNKSNKERTTRFNVLFNSKTKEKNPTNRDKPQTRFYINQPTID